MEAMNLFKSEVAEMHMRFLRNEITQSDVKILSIKLKANYDIGYTTDIELKMYKKVFMSYTKLIKELASRAQDLLPAVQVIHEVVADAAEIVIIVADAVEIAEVATKAVEIAEVVADAVEITEEVADAVEIVIIVADAVEIAEVVADAVEIAEVVAEAVETTKVATKVVETTKVATKVVETTKVATKAVEATKDESFDDWLAECEAMTPEQEEEYQEKIKQAEIRRKMYNDGLATPKPIFMNIHNDDSDSDEYKSENGSDDDDEDEINTSGPIIINVDDEDYEEKLKAYIDVPFTTPVNNGLKKKFQVAKSKPSKTSTATGSIKGLTTSIFHSLVTDKTKPKPKTKKDKAEQSKNDLISRGFIFETKSLPLLI